MARKVRVSFDATELDEGVFRVHGTEAQGSFVVYLNPEREGVEVTEIPRSYKLGQVYHVSANSEYGDQSPGVWVVIRDRGVYLSDAYKFVCPHSGNTYDLDVWNDFIANRTVELVGQLERN